METVIGENVPEWLDFKGSKQLVDPVSKKTIAFWSFKHNCPFFYDRGYYRANPNIANEYEFSHDPEYLPFKEKKAYIRDHPYTTSHME